MLKNTFKNIIQFFSRLGITFFQRRQDFFPSAEYWEGILVPKKVQKKEFMVKAHLSLLHMCCFLWPISNQIVSQAKGSNIKFNTLLSNHKTFSHIWLPKSVYFYWIYLLCMNKKSTHSKCFMYLSTHNRRSWSCWRRQVCKDMYLSATCTFKIYNMH